MEKMHTAHASLACTTTLPLGTIRLSCFQKTRLQVIFGLFIISIENLTISANLKTGFGLILIV
jgi:hypothetical protein